MSDELEEKIRARAFAIWEAQGHPDGLEEAHWHQAQAELATLDADAELPNPLATGAAAKAMTTRAKA